MRGTQYDLSNLFIKIQEIPDGVRVIDHHPELAVFRELSSTEDHVVRIAILSGDVDSPFVRIRERDVMVKTIFEYLNLDVKKEANQTLCQSIIDYEYQPYLFAWLKYLEIVNETDFTDWSLAKRQYSYFLKKANEPKDKDETDLQYMKRFKESRQQVKELGVEINEIEAKLFPDSKAARAAAIAEQAKKVHLYPERFAEPYSVL